MMCQKIDAPPHNHEKEFRGLGKIHPSWKGAKKLNNQNPKNPQVHIRPHSPCMPQRSPKRPGGSQRSAEVQKGPQRTP